MKKFFPVIVIIILGLMMVTACSNNSASNESNDMSSTDEAVSDDAAVGEDQTGESEAREFDAEKIKEQIELTELGAYTEKYINATRRGYATLAKNTSDHDIVLYCTFTFYGDDGEPVATAESSDRYVNAGDTALLFADDEMEPFEKAEVDLVVEEPRYTVLSNQMDIKETLRSDKVIVQLTNKSRETADPAGVPVAFYNGDELVDCRYIYCTTHDSPLKAGETVTEDGDWVSGSVDNVKVYPNASSNGMKALPDSLEGDLCKEDFIVGGDAASYWNRTESKGGTTHIINTNDLTELIQSTKDFYYVYYTPEVDASEEGVISTARGIHLGDSKDSVFKAYGKEKVVKFNPETDPFYNECDPDNQNVIKEIASEYVEYHMKNEPYGIVFYFDKNDKVSLVFFTYK